MGTTAIVSAILTLLAGIGIFLVACQMMSSNLESASSEKLKSLFARASKSKLLGVGIGTVGTAAIQSSGATTVMTIGFVNAGIITLTQAATIIFGANIGTTVTAQIVALGMFGSNALSTTVIFSAFAGIGAMIALFAESSAGKTWGGILTGFGMLFVGLSLMSGSMEEFAALEGVKTFLAKISNSLLLVLIGAVLTAIIAGVTSGTNAKRTALIHLLFNCSGVAVFLTVGWLMMILSRNTYSFGFLFDLMFPGAPQTQLAMFHTFFNVIMVIFMLPLTGTLVGLVTKMVKESDSADEGRLRLRFVDNNMLQTPPIAVQQSKREILRMAELSMENFDRSINIITSLDFTERDVFDATEQEINYINRALVDFVVRLSDRRGLGGHDKLYLSTVYRTVRDVERIADHLINVAKTIRSIQPA